jgi:hypothetical protein
MSLVFLLTPIVAAQAADVPWEACFRNPSLLDCNSTVGASEVYPDP